MDLTARLLRATPPRPLLVTAVGGRTLRYAAERLCADRGWRPAVSPAEANLFVLCGTPDAGTARAVDAGYDQVPLPRARADLTGSVPVPVALDAAVARLRDPARQRTPVPPATAPDPGHDAGHDAGHDGGPDNGHHGGHGGGHGMGMPGGVAMAERAPDRDGLMLDRLTVPLGPVLADWPAGLRVRLGMQGDVVQTVEVAVLATGDRPVPPEVAALDHAARLLALAGWDTAATEARHLRDAAAGGRDDDGDGDRLARWAVRVRRSRLLRWSLSGLGVVAAPGSALDGDVPARLYRWVEGLRVGTPRDPGLDTHRALAALPGTLTGTEFAAARLIVASLGIDLEAADR